MSEFTIRTTTTAGFRLLGQAERATTELAFAKASIESNTPYYLVMVMEGDEDGLEGTVTGYLDGEQIGQVDGIGRIFSHSDDTAIGGLRGQTLFEDGGVGDDIDSDEVRILQDVDPN